MKLLIKLTIVALVANATWRVGSVYLSHYKFKDSVQQMTQYRGDKSDEQIRQRIFELAAQFDIPVGEESLTIRRDEDHTIVDGSYKRPIDLLPGFTYAWPFTVHIDTFTVRPPKFDGSVAQ